MKRLHITMNEDIYAEMQEIKKYYQKMFSKEALKAHFPDSTIIQTSIHLMYKDIERRNPTK